jgi:hypothetical protein
MNRNRPNSANHQATTDALFDAVHAAEEMMDHARGRTAEAAQWRAESLSALRHYMSVQEIADRLGVQRAAVYAALNNAAEEEKAETNRLRQESIKSALQELHSALKDAQYWIAPFFETDLVLTAERRQLVEGVFSRLKGAQDAYDMALVRAGYLAPHRVAQSRVMDLLKANDELETDVAAGQLAIGMP